MTRDILNQGPHGGPMDAADSSPKGDAGVAKYQKWIRAAEQAKEIAVEWAREGDAMYFPDREKRRDKSVSGGKKGILRHKVNRLRRKINGSINQVYARSPKFLGKAKRPFMVIDESALMQMQQMDPVSFQQIQAGMIPPPQKDVSKDIANTVGEIMDQIFLESGFKSEMKVAVREAHHRPASIIQIGYQYDEDNKIDDVFFRRRSFNQFIIDPDAEIYEGEVRRCRFMGVKWELSKEEAEGMGLAWDALTDKDNVTQDATLKGKVYQIWDRSAGVVAWVPESGQRFAKQPLPWPWEIDGFPFVILKFSEDVDSQWSKPLILEAAGLDEEMDLIREEITKNTLCRRPINLYDSTMIDEVKVEEIAGRGKGAWQGIAGMSGMPNPPIQVFNDDGLPPEVYQHYQRCDDEMNEVIGTSSNAQLQTTKATATETQAVQANQDIMSSEKSDIITDTMNRIARVAVQIMRQTYNEARVTQITGSDGAQHWVEWVGRDILQDVDIAVEVGSIERDDTDTRRQVSLNLLNTVGGLPGFDIQKLGLKVLETFGERNPESFLLQDQVQQPMSQPMQQMDVNQAMPGGDGGGIAQSLRGQMSPMV